MGCRPGRAIRTSFAALNITMEQGFLEY